MSTTVIDLLANIRPAGPMWVATSLLPDGGKSFPEPRTSGRRHTVNHPNRAGRFWRRCRCSKWIRGLPKGKPIRVSAKTRIWKRAESKLRLMDDADGPNETRQVRKIHSIRATNAAWFFRAQSFKPGHRIIAPEIELNGEAMHTKGKG